MEYRYWLASLNGVGNATKGKLVDYFNGAYEIYYANENELMESGILTEALAKDIIRQKKAWRLKEEYFNLLMRDISLVTMDMKEFPSSLLNIHNCPYAIYYRGTLPDCDEKIIAMVGSRTPSQYGIVSAQEIAQALAKSGYSICSGMALGIDGISHEAALRANARTYAFLGCGADIIYPKRHSGLYSEIIKRGAVMSDLKPKSPPVAEHFPARNRLIAGMSQKTIVIEARKKSGSLITADFTLEQGKDIYVLPGRITDAMSEGCLNLIAQGASVITSVSGLLSDLSDLQYLDVIKDKNYPDKKPSLEKEEMLVYSCFDFYAKSIEEVCSQCGIELIDVLRIIMRLCEYGLICETFKNHYIRLK